MSEIENDTLHAIDHVAILSKSFTPYIKEERDGRRKPKKMTGRRGI